MKNPSSAAVLLGGSGRQPRAGSGRRPAQLEVSYDHLLRVAVGDIVRSTIGALIDLPNASVAAHNMGIEFRAPAVSRCLVLVRDTCEQSYGGGDTDARLNTIEARSVLETTRAKLEAALEGFAANEANPSIVVLRDYCAHLTAVIGHMAHALAAECAGARRLPR